jgi:hypothetical protein
MKTAHEFGMCQDCGKHEATASCAECGERLVCAQCWQAHDPARDPDRPARYKAKGRSA